MCNFMYVYRILSDVVYGALLWRLVLIVNPLLTEPITVQDHVCYCLLCYCMQIHYYHNQSLHKVIQSKYLVKSVVTSSGT